ncbi:Flagellar basal-body P-ring formation protein FlgA [Rhodovulum sp. P5]|uniref:flagellar basal body P-ring formation chaperone FlgA n=1 Tax=Rhodovulum sp. P5 TaxID=1564506 RepID=UPI0009C382D0|nr:flagellar basal body P-ring formation chaperone FlgA [Rhodovulum sp. P5]ARE40404.1 Flagellar basal-body P-ring formation protein FlgA [Rhodovulum sp. P5]
MKALALLALMATAQPVSAEMVVATRMIRGMTILGPDDVALVEGTTPGALVEQADAIGQEARVNLYAGRPIRAGDIGPPAIIERNQIVTVLYAGRGLTIAAEGRALERAGVGDMVRVMNLASRKTVNGYVSEDGTVSVGTTLKH